MRTSIILLFIGLVASACKSPECETARDCVDPLVCVDNACVKNTGGNTIGSDAGRPRDGGVAADGGDAMVADDASIDAGVDASTADGGDAAVIGDGGDAAVIGGDGGDAAVIGADGGDAAVMNTDGATIIDGGRIDYDSGIDGGVAPIVTLPTSGNIYYSELDAIGEESLELGVFLDRSQAMYSVLERRFPDSATGMDCTVTTTRLASGTELGFDGNRVEIVGLGAPMTVRPLLPVPGWLGYYFCYAPLQGQLFDRGEALGRIFSNSVSGVGLDDTAFPVGMPSATVDGEMPPSGTTLNLLTTNETFSWTMEPGVVTVEIADVFREVVLHCEVPSTITQYTIPAAAVHAWYSEQPPLPAYVEISHVEERSTMLPILNSFDTIPGTIRSARGVRYPIQ